MSKLKVEHGASKINLVLLKTSIEETISQDIDLMAAWSDNERRYIVNELLRFAIAPEENFQKYKASAAANESSPAVSAKAAPVKASSHALPKSESSPISTAVQE
jgi:hypothetical protein